MPPSPQLLRYSTDLLPERNRFAAFREGFARQVLNVDWFDLSEGRPRFELSFLRLGSVAVGSLVGTPGEVIRDAHRVQDGTDNFFLAMVGEGPHHSRHAGHDQWYDAGDALFIDQGRPQQTFAPQGGRVRNITIARSALKALVAQPEDMAGCLLRPNQALHLLGGYLASISALDEPPPVALASVIELHLVDLVAAAIGPTSDAREIVAKRGLRAARLRAALAEIARRCGDPALDVDSLAAALGESRRSTQRLLEQTGKSFIEHVTERRMQRAHAMLTDPAFAHLRVIDVALACGFGDVSHFNRVFRRHFGDTPSGVRTAAPRGQ